MRIKSLTDMRKRLTLIFVVSNIFLAIFACSLHRFANVSEDDDNDVQQFYSIFDIDTLR